jgi:hypothetical protein
VRDETAGEKSSFQFFEHAISISKAIGRQLLAALAVQLLMDSLSGNSAIMGVMPHQDAKIKHFSAFIKVNAHTYGASVFSSPTIGQWLKSPIRESWL